MATHSYPFGSALVTGASSGIGEAMTRQLGAAGVATVVVARRGDRLRALAAELDECEVLVADLATAAGQRAVAERIASESAPIGLVVNNAGFGTHGAFHTLAADRLAGEIEVNVAALTRLSHAALAAMVPRRRGWLLNVSSVAGFQAAPRLAVYAATKAYVTTFTESLHEEVAGTGVHVTALCPGLTRTEFQAVSNSEVYEQRFPSFAWTSVDDVARAGLDGVAAGTTLVVPGMLYRGLVGLSGVTPRRIARRVSALVQRG